MLLFISSVPKPKKPVHQLYVSAPARDRLRELAALLGYINIRGKYQGEGNTSALVEALGSDVSEVKNRITAALEAIEALEPLPALSDDGVILTGNQGRPKKKGYVTRSTHYAKYTKERVLGIENRLKLTVSQDAWDNFLDLAKSLDYIVKLSTPRGSASKFLEEFARNPKLLIADR